MYTPTSSTIKEVIDRLPLHSTEFSKTDLKIIVDAIVERAVNDFKVKDARRLRKGVLCAHRTKPIRLIALLHTCNADFPADVVFGIYRNYDPSTDTIKNGWTAQHSQPHQCFWC